MLRIKWHEEVKLIKGYLRSCVYDLPRNDYIFIPNSIYKSINQIEKKSACLIENLDEDKKRWFTVFEKNEYFFLIQEKLINCFPKLSLEWHSSSLVTNAIIDIKTINNYNSHLHLIEGLGCKHIAIRFIEVFKKNQIYQFFKKNNSVSRIQSIDIYILDSNELNDSDFKEICSKHPQINNIFILNSKCKKKMIKLSTFCNLFYLAENNIVHTPNFNVNISLFTESQKHNTYFNRKLYIGANGEIKNAPECSEIHGYIQDISNEVELKIIISKPEFQKYWFVHKGIVDVCKECEFRHMCVDSRIPYPNDNGTWYHKTECGYNPYIAKWQGEEGYVPVEECGTYTKEKGFEVNKRKVNKLNKEIWGED